MLSRVNRKKVKALLIGVNFKEIMMLVRQRKSLWLVLLFIAGTSTTLAFVSRRTSADASAEEKTLAAGAPVSFIQFGSRSSPVRADQASPESLAPEHNPVKPLGVIQLSIRPEAIEPAQVTVPKGKYLLLLSNRTGLPELSVQLSRTNDNEEKLKDLKFANKSRYRWKGLLELPPGDYLLSVPSHPEWVCRITATNN